MCHDLIPAHWELKQTLTTTISALSDPAMAHATEIEQNMVDVATLKDSIVKVANDAYCCHSLHYEFSVDQCFQIVVKFEAIF